MKYSKAVPDIFNQESPKNCIESWNATVMEKKRTIIEMINPVKW